MKRLDANAGSNSKLSKPVQDLIRMIFDVDSMQKAMLEFEVCPLVDNNAVLMTTRSLTIIP